MPERFIPGLGFEHASLVVEGAVIIWKLQVHQRVIVQLGLQRELSPTVRLGAFEGARDLLCIVIILVSTNTRSQLNPVHDRLWRCVMYSDHYSLHVKLKVG